MTTKSNPRACILLPVALLILLCAVSFAPTARADMGPKPSVVIAFENMDDRLCYGTLLSKYDSTGPQSAWDGVEADPERMPYKYLDGGETVWRAFVNYEDADGYYYLQCHWRLDEKKELDWSYYPPSPFKILLYYPDENAFVVSGVLERYAFHSYYSVDMAKGLDEVTQTLIVENNYSYGREIAWLIVRIVTTVLIELGVAWLFKLRGKKEMLIVLGVNAVTQIALNIAINVLHFYNGMWALIWYIPLELGVIAIETAAYALTLRDPKRPNRSVGYCALYAFCANVLSFAVGSLISFLVPGVF